MSDFETILKKADDSSVELTDEIKKLLGTELQFGMSNYVCQNGTLSDGFEKITPAQRYYQAVKECWTYANSLQDEKARALQFQTRLKIDNILDKLFGWMPIFGFYFRGRKMYSTRAMACMLMEIEDKTRVLNAFNEARLKLMPEVRAKYKSIEEAEPDNWEAVMKFRIARQKLGKQEFLNHVPGTAEDKALMGLAYNAPEAALWLAVEKEKEIDDRFDGNMVKYLESLGHLKTVEFKQTNVLPLKKDK